MKFEVTEDKLELVLKRVSALLETKGKVYRTTNRKVARVVGHLASLYRAFPGFARQMLQSCYATIEVSREQGSHIM